MYFDLEVCIKKNNVPKCINLLLKMSNHMSDIHHGSNHSSTL